MDNHEEYKSYVRKHHKYNRKHNQKMIEYDRNHAKEQRESGYQKEYQEKNKEYLGEYRKLRAMHKTHDISNLEWGKCKEYFDNKCAYCGMSIEDHYVLYAGKLKKMDFHKEHVNHKGSNKIDNCVPSCHSCNSRKWAFDFEEWYNENNENYTAERLSKILKWINEDHISYIK